MVNIPEKGIKYKAARKAFMGNYFLATLAIFFFLLVALRFNLYFSLIPLSFDALINNIVILGFFWVISFMFEQPILEGMIRKYYVTPNEVIKIEGIFNKNRVALPYQSIADINVSKSFFGRIFNYGNVKVAGFKDSIEMRSMSDPEEIQKIIQNKINIMRESTINMRKKAS